MAGASTHKKAIGANLERARGHLVKAKAAKTRADKIDHVLHGFADAEAAESEAESYAIDWTGKAMTQSMKQDRHQVYQAAKTASKDLKKRLRSVVSRYKVKLGAKANPLPHTHNAQGSRRLAQAFKKFTAASDSARVTDYVEAYAAAAVADNEAAYVESSRVALKSQKAKARKTGEAARDIMASVETILDPGDSNPRRRPSTKKTISKKSARPSVGELIRKATQ